MQYTEQAILNYLEEYGKTVKYSPALMQHDMMETLNFYYDNQKEIKLPELKSYVSMIKKILESNDYSHIDGLSDKMIAIVSSKAYYDSKKENRSSIYDEIYDESKALNPFYRRGLELASTSSFLPEAEQECAQQVSEQMNEIIMKNTLTPSAEEIKQGAFDDDRKRNLLERITIAKILFLSHLGNMYIMQSDGRNAEFKGSVADSMAHGGRTSFLLPAGDKDRQTDIKEYLFNVKYHFESSNENDSLQEKTRDHGSPVKSRIAATHSMSSGKAAEGAGSFKESGTVTLFGNYQMNPAIGGYGKEFGNHKILNDGKNGQVFMQLQTGDEDKGGYLMVGFENEASQVTGRTGHSHSIKGTEGKFSCFMAGKGGPGASKNGRVVDLSMYTPLRISTLLEKFNEKYTEMLNKALLGNDTDRLQLDKINRMLCGKIMDRNTFLDMTNELGIDKKKVQAALDDETAAKKRFSDMNIKAEEKIAKERKRLNVAEIPTMGEDDDRYITAPGIQKLLNQLNKAKGKGYDFTMESDKMARIKLQFADLTDAAIKGKLGKENAAEAFKNMYKACADYIYDTSKNQSNDRMKAVRAIFNYTDNELNKLDVSDDARQELIDSVKSQKVKKQPEEKIPDKNILQ